MDRKPFSSHIVAKQFLKGMHSPFPLTSPAVLISSPLPAIQRTIQIHGFMLSAFADHQNDFPHGNHLCQESKWVSSLTLWCPIYRISPWNYCVADKPSTRLRLFPNFTPLRALLHQPFSPTTEHKLDIKRALLLYLKRPASCWKGLHLFICHSGNNKGNPESFSDLVQMDRFCY